MPRLCLLVLAALVASAATASAQALTERCVTPDSIAIEGNARVSARAIRADANLEAGRTLNFRVVQQAIRALFQTGQFDDVRVSCSIDQATAVATLTIHVVERPLLGDVQVEGADRVSSRTVQEQVDLIVGRPVDPAGVARVVQRLDSLYEQEGYYLARITPETTFVNDRVNLLFRIAEGRRLAISGVRINGNELVGDRAIVRAMETRPEGFLWFRRGEFEEARYNADLVERIPGLYANRGFIDFQIVSDTLIVDRELGKAMVELTVAEGPQYKIGDFEIVGNRVFPTSHLQQLYPFTGEGPTITERVMGVLRRTQRTPADVFDEERWEEATNRVRTAYANEGYIWSSVRPVVERETDADGTPVVHLRWEIDERSPAIINRVEIAGNDFTVEQCIRDQILMVPGDVYNQERLIRSYHGIANMGFFETPLPVPEQRPANEEGDVDIIFNVTEKRTGNINFGASVGEGTGIGGFIGLDQPNLFGRCKRGSLQWQFGRYNNDFNLSYTDPSIQQSRISGTFGAYRSQQRFQIEDYGRSTRTGGTMRFGFPVPWSRFTRAFVSYGGEGIKYTDQDENLTQGSLFDCTNCIRSTLGADVTHDTRINLPFATAGSLQSLSAQFNGGPLGGTVSFQRYTGELRGYAPLFEVGGGRPGSQPITFVLGITGRGGAVFGNPGPFFHTQQFALGGTQYGEMLRGYEEFSITPRGFISGTSAYRASRESFGNAFFSTTAEFGIRFNQMVYLSMFHDAGNVWGKPRHFDPTRLYRGAGIGASVVTPFGPLGIDWAYGFDRVDALGRPDPRWQFHFRLGQIF